MTHFTKLEQEIIVHRLTVPYCIIENLIEDDSPADFDDSVYDACTRLEHLVKSKSGVFDISAIEKEVLANCVHSSTWIGCLEGDTETSEQMLSSHKRTMIKLAEKVSAIVGFEVEPQLY